MTSCCGLRRSCAVFKSALANRAEWDNVSVGSWISLSQSTSVWNCIQVGHPSRCPLHRCLAAALAAFPADIARGLPCAIYWLLNRVIVLSSCVTRLLEENLNRCYNPRLATLKAKQNNSTRHCGNRLRASELCASFCLYMPLPHRTVHVSQRKSPTLSKLLPLRPPSPPLHSPAPLTPGSAILLRREYYLLLLTVVAAPTTSHPTWRQRLHAEIRSNCTCGAFIMAPWNCLLRVPELRVTKPREP